MLLTRILGNLLITVAIAGGTAGLQTLMKGNSRTNLPGRRHGLTKDDALFWTDWTVAASLALVSSITLSLKNGREVLPWQIWFSAITIVCSCCAFPFFLRVFAYDRRGRIKSWGWRGIGWILIANSVGMIVLLGAVMAGAEIYETR
jgi:hypothetical protein